MLAVSSTEVRNPYPQKRCPVYNTKLHLVVMLQLWSFRKCGVNHLLTLLSGSLRPGVVVSIEPSMGQIG